MKTLLTLKDVHCCYNGQEVLSGISLEISAGDFLAIMGPNGAGKTTLLRAATASIDPVRGEIRLLGKNIRDYSRREIARFIAVLPQNIQTPFAFGVRELLEMARHPHHNRFTGLRSSDRQIIQTVAQKTDIVPFLDRKITQLSAGERQRVFLAQALIQQPQILFLDEPITHLDLGHQMEIFRLLKEVNQEGVAVVAILHDLTFAFHFSQKIVLLNNGKIHARGTPQEVLTPENIHTVFHARLQLVPQPDSPVPLLKYDM